MMAKITQAKPKYFTTFSVNGKFKDTSNTTATNKMPKLIIKDPNIYFICIVIIGV